MNTGHRKTLILNGLGIEKARQIEPAAITKLCREPKSKRKKEKE
jgi:hypothetical protein